MSAFWSAIRAQFPALAHCTYLNTATFGQLSQRTQQATQQHYARRDEHACSDFLSWFDDMDVLRADVAHLIQAPSPANIAFFPNASTVFSLLMGGMEWKPGDRVVTLENEFPNNIYLPSLQIKHGVEFVVTSWADFWNAITPRTRLVAISTVNWATGLRPPLEELCAKLRSKGILIYLDATQSCGALRLNIGEVKPDVVGVDAYKWMCSPNGAGFGYFSPQVCQWLDPSIIGWRSHKTWRQVDALHTGVPEFPDGAERYEGGMIPFPSLYGMAESVRQFLEIGSDVVEQRVLSLSSDCKARMQSLGAELLADGRDDYNSSIIAARWPGVDSSALARKLRERGVHVSSRYGWLRVSIHFYNVEDDLQHFAEEIRSWSCRSMIVSD